MKSRSKLSTKSTILDVAERHFASFGFAGTSLRGVIKDAGVNVASVAYHYGSKEDLFNAVIERFAQPVVSAQLAALDVLSDASLKNILEAFYLPPLRLVQSRGEAGAVLGLFLGRMQTEPDPIFSIVDRHFAICRGRFINAFRKLFPHASEADLQWNFEFMLSLIVCFLTRQEQIRQRYADPHEWTPEEATKRMILFCQSGFAEARNDH